MANFASDFATQLAQQVAAQTEAIAGCWERCFEQLPTLVVAPAAPWAPGTADVPDQPGLLITLVVDAGCVLVAIPARNMPGWYAQPDETQASRLGTIGMELSMCVLPEEFMTGDFSQLRTHDLQASCETAASLPQTAVIPLFENPGDDPLMIVIGPFTSPPQAITATPAAATSPATPGPAATPASPATMSAASATNDHSDLQSGDPAVPEADLQEERRQHLLQQIERIRRLMPLKVKVSVRLAERRVELRQLLNVTPGAILQFPKQCDELLDLYVNNQLYARGEAVKIGETFGLKINELGSSQQRDTGVLIV